MNSSKVNRYNKMMKDWIYIMKANSRSFVKVQRGRYH